MSLVCREFLTDQTLNVLTFFLPVSHCLLSRCGPSFSKKMNGNQQHYFLKMDAIFSSAAFIDFFET